MSKHAVTLITRGTAGAGTSVLLLLALLVVAASCAGDEETITIGPDGGTIRSEDGALTLEIPAGALHDETSMAIRALTADEWPEELARLDVLGEVYELSPSGLTFSEPVTVIRRLDAAALGVDLGDRVPLVLIAHSRADGTWSLLEGISVRADAGEIVAEAQTIHFSNQVVLWHERITFSLDAPAGPYLVGETFTVTGQIELIEAPEQRRGGGRFPSGVDLRELWAYTGQWEWTGWDADPFRRVGELRPDDPPIIELSAGPVLRPDGATVERFRRLLFEATDFRLDDQLRVTPEFDPAEIGTILLVPPASWEFEVSYTCVASGVGHLGIGAAFGRPDERVMGSQLRLADEVFVEMFPDWYRPQGDIREMEVIEASVDCINDPTGVEHPLKFDVRLLPPGFFEPVAEPQGLPPSLIPWEMRDALGLDLAERPDDADDDEQPVRMRLPPEMAEEVGQLLDEAGYREWEIIVVSPGGRVIEILRSTPMPDDEQRAEGPGPGLHVEPIRAVFHPPSQSTTYRAAFTHEPRGRVLFEWSEPDCGSWEVAAEFDGERVTDLGQGGRDRGGFPPNAVSEGELIFVWSHPHPPCDPTTDHAHVTIQLQVESAEWSPVVCTYQGAATGTGPPCERRR